jgi:hypothetical protein
MSRRSNFNRGIGWNVVFTLIALAVCIGGGMGVAAWALGGDDPTVQTNATSAPTVNNEPPNAGVELPMVDLLGEWSAENNGTKFVAKIESNTIDIKLVVADGTSMTYWVGSFKTVEAPGTTITSNLVETNDLVLSNATSKDFVVQQDTIKFDFKMRGMTKPVVLNRV